MKIRLALIIIIVIFQLINSNLSAQQTQKAPFFEVEVFDSTFIDLNSIGITASTISLAFAYDNLVPFDIPNEYHSVWGMFYAKDFWPIYRKDLFKPTNGSAPTSTAQAYDLDESNNYQSVYEFADRTNESEPNGQYKLMDDKQNVILDYYGIPLNPEIHGGGYSSDKKYHYPVVETIAYNGDDDERDFMIYEDLYVYSIQTGENRKVFDYLHHAGTTMGIPEYQYAGTPDIIGAFIDRTHVNAVDDHPFEDAAIVSYRHNAVWKVNYIEGSEVGEVDWILGGPPGWASSHGFREVVPKIEGQDLQTRLQHSASFVDSSEAFGIIHPGDVLIFDNGDTNRLNSRALVIRIEEDGETVTGEIIWEMEFGRSEFMGSFKLLPISDEEGLAIINQPHRSDDSMFFALTTFGEEGALQVINNMGSNLYLIRVSTKDTLVRYQSKMLNYVYAAYIKNVTNSAGIDCSSPENASIDYDNVVWHYANGDTIPPTELDLDDFDDLRYYTFSNGTDLYGGETSRGFSRVFDFGSCLSVGIKPNLVDEVSILIQNPAKNKLQFTTEVPFQIFNQEGKLMLTGNGSGANVQDLPSGVYHLNYTLNQAAKTEKVVLLGQ